ncbi:hypothetical protein JL475_12585 [Streptomyces sp. M2CJ-2]|uniref:hypothetical protein n=1 Tax=Streptomyces sp. M2CJ-2 TaxID=2803948 RepID=UPI001925D050|nr:hypothetical protein [Streptomyces sp. M2CJ-2]MBL3666813.1 hypothetical protein [Streptomyces sp. M2CJ-2]
MRERSEVAGEPGVTGEVSAAGEAKSPRIDLSTAQVAGSAVAAVLGAQLASSFGVYGTIIGAGVMSIVATCGGTLFQHFFKRTGEQFRGAAGGPGRPVTAAAGRQAVPAPGEFTEGTVYRGRARGVRWNGKRMLGATALVFGLTMAGITTYELVSGQSLSGTPSTTIGNAVTGQHTSGTEDSGGSGGSDDQYSGDPDDSGTSDDPGTSDGSEDFGGDGPAPAPSATPQDGGAATGSGGDTPDGDDASTGTPDGTGDQGSSAPVSPEPDVSATTPGPSADSRFGSGVQDQGGPAVP